MPRPLGNAILNFTKARLAASRGVPIRVAIDSSEGRARVVSVWLAGKHRFNRANPMGQYRVRVTFKGEQK